MLDIDQRVRQVVPVIEGVVKEIQYNNASRSLEMLVEWVQGEETYQRWFKEADLEAV
jgi:hypothetical protein